MKIEVSDEWINETGYVIEVIVVNDSNRTFRAVLEEVKK